MPISLNLVIALTALFVCTVDKTKCPVKLAWIAISAVSLSLISPTITISGSCLKIALKPFAKLNPVLLLTCVCPIPSRAYSTGSSMVRMFCDLSEISFRPAYKDVVFPDPVGPVTRIIPSVLDNPFLKLSNVSVEKPRSFKFICVLSLYV